MTRHGSARRLLATLAACCGLLAATQAQAQLVEEVPFITTPDNVTLAMLQLAAVEPGDHVIDLGSGDGRIVITAAKRFGATGLGVEIVPDLVARSRASAQQAGVAQRVEFREQDLFKTDLSAATVITMYLLPEVNLQLRPALLQLAPGTRIVSHDWDMGDWLPDQTVTVAAPDKKIGRDKSSRLHRWVVPARAEGLWCGPAGTQLRVAQTYQNVRAQWRERITQSGTQGSPHSSREWALHGVLQGRQLQMLRVGLGALSGPVRAQVHADRIDMLPRASGRVVSLRKSDSATCP